MPTRPLSAPARLGIFISDPATGRPVARLPLYAEVAVPRTAPVPAINDRFREPLRAALIDVDPTAVNDHAVRDRVEAAALQALAETVDEASSNNLMTQPDRAKDLFRQILKEALVASGRARMSEIPLADLKPLMVTALRRAGPEFGVAIAPEVEDVGTIWADPLGVLTTDHVGYASFDLRRLRPDVQVMLAEAIEARRSDPDAVMKLAIWIYPYGLPGRFDALSQARFALDAVVARLFLTWNTLPPALINMGPRALQNPSLTDWRLSPASFAASPKSLIGENGCEELTPANLALQEFVLRQVVRLVDIPLNFGLPAGFKAAYVDDYKVSWYSLGHSLGEILYSLPLAPGETVKLAVIDWSWDSTTKRDETTKLTEELLHQTHRDRTISETVKAGVKELQHGSSFMGGTASAAGGSGGANLGVVGLGAAVGNTWSLGGSTATSDGSRDLAAENVQRLNDSFSQASSAQREINSTVVIQARQEEKESIQTRTFSNYNHSHTLTVLYYEVLRHYRVTVEWVRRRQAVLVKMPMRLLGVLTAGVLLARRYLLEPYFLDTKLAAAFDAAARYVLGEEKLKRETNKWAANTQTIDPGTKMFDKLIAQFTTTGDDTSEPVFVALLLHDGRTFEFQCDGAGDEGISAEFEKPLPVPIMWKEIKGVEVKLKDINSGGDWEESNILITMGTPANERVSILADSATRTIDDNMGTTGLLLSVQPPPATTTNVGPKPQRIDFVSAEDDLAVASLIAHVEANRTYYNSVLMLATDPNTIASEFEGKPWGPGQVMSDHVDPTPLDVFGSYVAYPLAKQLTTVDDTVVVDIAAALNGDDPARRQWALDRLAAMNDADRQSVLERLPLASAKSERLNTMPTRGVFAEGKLGHCNVSEEIDNTKFWKWEEHPIPIEAPGINPVTPIQPTPQQVSAMPTAFPQSLVNIVNPSPAPDPTGLTAALSLLGTPNIFRDMSGRQEVADLLKKLSDNSIAIADAATRAREIQGKYGSNLQGLDQGGGANTSGAAGVSSRPGQATTSNDATKGVQQLAGANNDLVGYADPAVIKKNANKISDSTAHLAARLAFGLDAGAADAGAIAGAPLNVGRFETFVTVNKLDLEIADVLHALDEYPADSWAKQTAAFAHQELSKGNLLGIFSSANPSKAKAVTPTSEHAAIDAGIATIGNAFGRNAIGSPGAYRGVIVINDSLAQGGVGPGSGRRRLAQVLTHELTHFRNRDFFVALHDSAVADNPSFYLDLAKANAHANTPRIPWGIMGEVVCNHVAWRVDQDLLHKSTGAVIPANPNKKGFFRYALALDGGGWSDNGYLADLKAAGKYNQQIAEWLFRIGGEKALFHDDLTKNGAVRQFFKDTHDEVKPQFLKPTEPAEGGV